MNLNKNPTISELRKLFAAANDKAGHHVMWVDQSGEVHLDVVPENLTVPLSQALLGLALQFPIWVRGNDYVGPDAASAVAHMQGVFDALTKAWAAYHPSSGVVFVDGL